MVYGRTLKEGTNFDFNKWNTTLLVLNVMATVARHLKLDINDNEVADQLYWICCDLENFPEDQGFGSSDHYGYTQAAKKEFEIDDNTITGGYTRDDV